MTTMNILDVDGVNSYNTTVGGVKTEMLEIGKYFFLFFFSIKILFVLTNSPKHKAC
jgi:hypothetical protein